MQAASRQGRIGMVEQEQEGEGRMKTRIGRPTLAPGERTSRITVSLPLSVRDYYDRMAAQRGPDVSTAEVVRERLSAICDAQNRQRISDLSK
jgi:hypothetical protein